MSETKLAGIEHFKKTLSVKKIQEQNLTIDIYYSNSPLTKPRPALLYFHGGFLVPTLLVLTLSLT